MKRAKKDSNRIKIILAGVGVLTFLVILIAVLASSCSAEKEMPSVSREEEYVPSGMKYIEDIYNGRYLIPDYDIPLSRLDTEKFVSGEKHISYPGGKLGIDVSDHQREIDWAAVKADGVDFAILRAGFRGYTEGGIFEDEYFKINAEKAKENGIEIGVYFFSQAVSADEAAQEAAYVLNLIEGYEIKYPVYFDWEPITEYSGTPPRTLNCTAAEITEFTVAFCSKVKEAGYIPGYYTNKYMGYNTYDLAALSDYELWYAEYQPKPSFYYEFEIWQYTESGTVSGINTGVDMNLSFKNY